MKRIPLLLLTACCAFSSAMAQRLDIMLKDASIVSVDIDKIDYMEIGPEAIPGQPDGVYYLLYKTTTTSPTKVSYNERLLFNGNQLKWKKSTSETIYNLEYSDDKRSFKAVKEGNSTGVTYSILGWEENLLVLKSGSYNYYFYKDLEKGKNQTFYGYLTRKVETDTTKVWGYRSGSSYSASCIMGSHFAKFPAATEADKEWLAKASNEPDASYIDVGGYTTWTAKNIELYPYGSPLPADVNQHAIGNCCFCAVLASFAYHYPEWIKTIITKESSTSFLVKMFDPQGNPIDVRVTNRLLCNSSGGCAQMTGKGGKFTWASILEKALFKYETRFKCNGIGGIGTEHAAPPFTGVGESYAFGRNVLHNSEMKLIHDYAMKRGMIGIGGFGVGGLMCGQLETVTGHAFTLMYTTDPEHYMFGMRNPWGNDGQTHADGVLEIPEDREIIRTIDFRLVYPGPQMAAYKVDNSGGYVLPKYLRNRNVGPTQELLRSYGLDHYGPIFEDDETEETVEE